MSPAEKEALEIEQAMALLSPAEREAMQDDGESDNDLLDQLQDNGDNERQNMKDLPEKTTLKDTDLGDGDEDEDDTDDKPAPDDKDEPEAATEVAEEPPVEEPPRAAPVQEFAYSVPPVEDYDAKMAALNTERTTALKDLLAGEIDEAEYAAVDARTLSESNALNMAQNRHLMAEDMRQQQAVASWNREIYNVKAQAKNEGVDYDTDPKMARAWDAWVKALGADPENNAQPGEWFLKEAHARVKIQYNLTQAVQQPVKAQPKPAIKARTPDLSNIPPTLGKAPAAATESEGESGEFAYLDKLKGLALERAVAKLSPEQEARYTEG